MSDKEKKKWNYKEGEGRYGWFDDYLYPGEHHGQVSHRAAVAKNRINKVANDTGLKRESVKHQYDIHKYDDQPGEPTATSTRAQQKNYENVERRSQKQTNKDQQNLNKPKKIVRQHMTSREALEEAFKNSSRKKR